MRKSIAKRVRLIKKCRLYSTKELARELGVHPMTIHSWQKQGLKPVDPSFKPFIFRGIDAKAFLKARSVSRKRKLLDGEFYCVRCRQPVESLMGDITVNTLGQGTSLHVRGKCRICRASLNRFMSLNNFETSIFRQICTTADSLLNESQHPNVKTYMPGDHNHE